MPESATISVLATTFPTTPTNITPSLSGGNLILLDEPTKGIDNFFKESLGEIFHRLKERGTTIIMVSHDIEFCCRYGDTCAMFFDGSIITVNSPREFFSGNSFYTTAAQLDTGRAVEHAIDEVSHHLPYNLLLRPARPIDVGAVHPRLLEIPLLLQRAQRVARARGELGQHVGVGGVAGRAPGLGADGPHQPQRRRHGVGGHLHLQ